jgi:HSP20 family protein
MARERSKEQEGSQSVEKRQGGQTARYPSWPALGPFSFMRRFADEMDRMWEGSGFPSWGRFIPSTRIESFSPQIDIFEREGKLILRADLPGLNKDDVKVEVTDNAVIIDGERKYEHEENAEGVYRSERSYGHFHREIPLPDGIKTESANASFKNGVLEVIVDTPQPAKNRRKIEIKGEGGKPGQEAA